MRAPVDKVKAIFFPLNVPWCDDGPNQEVFRDWKGFSYNEVLREVKKCINEGWEDIDVIEIRSGEWIPYPWALSGTGQGYGKREDTVRGLPLLVSKSGGSKHHIPKRAIDQALPEWVKMPLCGNAGISWEWWEIVEADGVKPGEICAICLGVLRRKNISLMAYEGGDLEDDL